MARISAVGVELDLPPGWDGRIRRPPIDAAVAPSARPGGRPVHRPTVAQAATIPLAPTSGDYGSGVVERLGSGDAFFSLIEFEPESAATPLFADTADGPVTIRADDLDPLALQNVLPGQSGVQRFFNLGGRAFCLYVVLGSHAARAAVVPRVNEALAGIRIT